jgi:hypothetical protein
MTDLQENTETKMQALQHSIDEISHWVAGYEVGTC